ncbi:hypothetical protein HanXRQr2_Chr04g0146591 [Helianthus annuus]|uniref:Uncharacterized protein n=1 Tax=Helianthus annuus TaxID=4232 RepID=A0A9K3J4C2_HELAN|nr:hypothetical protein HanXRQr2_Chr04g0146591 [Helianthus annuus]
MNLENDRENICNAAEWRDSYIGSNIATDSQIDATASSATIIPNFLDNAPYYKLKIIRNI